MKTTKKGILTKDEENKIIIETLEGLNPEISISEVKLVLQYPKERKAWIKYLNL